MSDKRGTCRQLQSARKGGKVSPESADKTLKRVAQCAATLRQATGGIPELGIILGSGFQPLLSEVVAEGELGFARLPGFPDLSVAGHLGKLVWGRLGRVRVIICCGRAHYYEGHRMDEVTWPVRVLAECGVTDLVLTNAAGAINRRYRPGEFMLFLDHINFIGENPLCGITSDNRRFVDLSHTYSTRLTKLFLNAAQREKIPLHQGVYLGVSGPTYETPAEIRAFARLGADAVGMSTIPEAIMARYCGMEVAALSCLTNPAAGFSAHRLSHEHVLAAAESSSRKAVALLRAFAAEYVEKTVSPPAARKRS